MTKVKLKNKNKRSKNKKIFFFIFLFICTISLTFHYLLGKNINIDNKTLLEYLLKNSNYTYDNTKDKKNSLNRFKEHFSVIQLINFNYHFLKKYNTEKKIINNKKTLTTNKSVEQSENPLIYIYNSHQTEEYKEVDDTYNIKPTVTINNYIMKDIFESNGLKTLVEERNIRDVLTLNNWNYASSYRASRVFLEDVRKNYQTLKYFIDVHRDSLNYDKTTITIGDKTYAKIIFLIGLENPEYSKNLNFASAINKKIEESYPGLSKGIYQKGGVGVNGIYNQDFSPNTILIEIGGVDNHVEEVMNTTTVLASILSEVIKSYEV